MNNPWTNNDSAFDAMFTEEISLTGKRENLDINTTIKCVVFTDTTGDPFASDTINTEREDITISVQPEFFGYVQKLKRGDLIFRPFNSKNYKVIEMKNDVAIGWIIKAREV